MQVHDSFRTYGRHVPLRYLVVYGGVPIEPQTKELLAGVEILVATPGRLLDHVGQRTVNLQQVEILVLDEADRMLDMGFMPDIRRIVELLGNRKQTLLFSATFSAEIRRLARSLLNDPVSVDIEPETTSADTVEQVVYLVDADRKRELLAQLVRRRNLHQVLVFTRTKLQAGRLASQLDRDGVEAIAIHGDRSQPERERALAAFKERRGARAGGDRRRRARLSTSTPCRIVVNFELPHTPHDYVHRIGRTGRAGAAGEAISLVAPDEEDYLRQVNRLLKRDLPVRVVQGFEPTLNGARKPAPMARTGGTRRHVDRLAGPRPAGGRRQSHDDDSVAPIAQSLRARRGALRLHCGPVALPLEDYALIGDTQTAALVGYRRLHRLAVRAALRLGRLLRGAARRRRERPLAARGEGRRARRIDAATSTVRWCSRRSGRPTPARRR